MKSSSCCACINSFAESLTRLCTITILASLIPLAVLGVLIQPGVVTGADLRERMEQTFGASSWEIGDA